MLSFFFINCITKYCCLFCWRPAVMASALLVAFHTLFTCFFIFMFVFLQKNKFFFFFFFLCASTVLNFSEWQLALVLVLVKIRQSSAHNASVPDELWAQRDQPALEDIKWAGLRHRGGETVPDWNSPMNHGILEEVRACSLHLELVTMSAQCLRLSERFFHFKGKPKWSSETRWIS